MKTKPRWIPTALDCMELMLLTLIDKYNPPYDALYLYGPLKEGGEIVENMIAQAKNMHRIHHATRIVLNGTPYEETQKRGQTWMGVEFWKSVLNKTPSIPDQDVFYLPPVFFTAEESEQLLRLSVENGWNRLCIMAVPHHLPRCVLNIVATMEKLNIHKHVYAVPATVNHNWNEMTARKVFGGKDIIGPLHEHIKAEYERIVKYGGGASQDGIFLPPCATVSELKAYLQKRERQDR